MKCKTPFLTLMVLVAQHGFAQVPSDGELMIQLTAEKINNNNDGNQHPKVPVMPPMIGIYDHTLNFFNQDMSESTLQIIQGNSVVFSLPLFSNMGYLVLPYTLAGPYLLRIVRGNYYFSGYINL